MSDAPAPPTRRRGVLVVDAISIVAMLIVLYAVSLTWDMRIDRTFDLVVIAVASVVLVASLTRMVMGFRRR